MRTLLGLACWRTSFLSAKMTLENRSRRNRPLCDGVACVASRVAGRRLKRSASFSVDVLREAPSCKALVK
ncbi:hypothetical protein D3C71_1636020 [compost metagenome]